ncbi:unnamed protein product (macronuclear) [Paramecium tetraurelia]|uniref:Malectin domain-containing protein n=1 Tax=Paramecium tetraurelia TaxID=5888 RepID=A0CP96_PARTE|nr:uncharacterized protein GSPATT00009004001 [Paramecium tetraurelia]CAK72613.1 unnamed protein product [Paramecium tetraurelia]|eukprot:XP_001440010.1 hypothetical protein (macronuclear) [Paramecium tetraurelia strain d4-2]
MQKKARILRGYYKDVVSFKQINLISRKNTYFYGGQLNSLINRDAIYYVNSSNGYSYCPLHKSIEIFLNKKYEINTVVIQIWDRLDTSHYDFEVYISFEENEIKIYENASFAGFIRIKFEDQLVDKIRIYNRGGSGFNGNLSVIKVQAFYSIQN